MGITNCTDQAVESIAELVTIRVRSMHTEDNQTQSLRDVDPAAHDVVWAIIDGGRNGCSHNGACRQNTDAMMKVLGLHPISLHGKTTTFNDTGRTTKNGKLKIPKSIIFICCILVLVTRAVI